VDGDDDEEDEEEEKILTFWQAIFWLSVDTVLISVFSGILVGSIEGSAEVFFSTALSSRFDALFSQVHPPTPQAWNVPKIFIGVILIPIVGNAAEHTSAIIVAYKGKMELALGVAIVSTDLGSIFHDRFLISYLFLDTWFWYSNRCRLRGPDCNVWGAIYGYLRLDGQQTSVHGFPRVRNCSCSHLHHSCWVCSQRRQVSDHKPQCILSINLTFA
jgi:hypothetical protein